MRGPAKLIPPLDAPVGTGELDVLLLCTEVPSELDDEEAGEEDENKGGTLMLVALGVELGTGNVEDRLLVWLPGVLPEELVRVGVMFDAIVFENELDDEEAGSKIEEIGSRVILNWGLALVPVPNTVMASLARGRC